MAIKAVLLRIDHDREISRETDAEFLFSLQRSLLLDLKEEGFLSETQLSYADSLLNGQFRKSQKHPGR